jgi:hypothetical protein
VQPAAPEEWRSHPRVCSRKNGEVIPASIARRGAGLSGIPHWVSRFPWESVAALPRIPQAIFSAKVMVTRIDRR